MSMRVIAPTPNSTKKEWKVRLVVWHGGRKHVACLRTIRSCIENMFQGVTYGFSYKMRLVYAHFPINVIINDAKDSVEIRNFLGEKIVRHVPMLEGVTIRESTNVKVSFWHPRRSSSRLGARKCLALTFFLPRLTG